MTETEKRRSELLAQTRARYSDRYAPPAIHPRYGSAYYSLYHGENSEPQGGRIGSLGVRLLIAVMLFCLYVLAEYQGMKETEAVATEIVRDYAGFVDFDFLD